MKNILNLKQHASPAIADALEKCSIAFRYVALFSLAANILMLIFPLYSMQVFDRVMSSRSMDTLGMLSLLMFVVLVFLGAFTLIRSLLLNRIGLWLDMELAPVLFNRSLRGNHSEYGAAAQQQRDLTSVKSFITGSGIITLFDLPWSLLYVGAVFIISPFLGWITLMGCGLLVLFAYITEQSTKQPTEDAQGAQLKSLGFVDMAARNAETVEALGMAQAIRRQWHELHRQHLQLQETANDRSAFLQSISRSVRMLLQIMITGLGAYLALHSELTAGGMIAASILSGRAMAPFENAIGFWKLSITARSAFNRLNDALSRPLRERGTMQLPEHNGELSVEHLHYMIEGVNKPILHAINLRLNAGESLGIIGPSAAGKSTLARLLIGTLTPTSGAVRLNGNDISTWNREQLGPLVGYLPQHSELFPGTIRDNIARLRDDATDDMVIEAARLAGVHDMIQRLPMGYDTVWSASNPLLSPGQRQRVFLARAFFGTPRFVVLDEPNNHLDGEGEVALSNALKQLKERGVTVVMVTHKASSVAHVDTLLVLQNGTIAQLGAREQVLPRVLQPAPGLRIVKP